MKFETGQHYQLITISKEYVIARFDHYKEKNAVGFMFVTPDGVEFIERDSLQNFGIAKVKPVEFIATDKPFNERIVDIIQNKEVVNYSISLVLSDDSTFTTVHNEWKPMMLVGEVSWAQKHLLESDSMRKVVHHD